MNGLLELSEGILCKIEVLGKTFDSSIAGVEVKIHFPQPPLFDEETPKVGFAQYLPPPEIAKTWKRGSTPLSWGYPQSYPSGNSCVELLAISVNCSEDDRIEKARALYSGIKSWGKAFTDYLILSTKQNSGRDKNNLNKSNCFLQLIGTECVPGVENDMLYAYLPNPDTFAGRDQIIEALQFAGSGKEIKLEYQMLLSAYEARRNCRNRQAIIDACSAVELRLDSNINELIKKHSMNPKLFLDKFKSLGDKFDLIKQLDETFPIEDHHTIIVTPRNDIAHNREVYPTDEITDSLFSCVERCLEHNSKGYY